jgi:hypothetical protein
MRERLTVEGRKERLAILLAAGRPVRASAAECGLEERTAYGWLATPAFKARIVELRSQILDMALGRLTDASCKAVDTLVALLDEDSPNIRLRAAASILEILGRYKDHVEIERRLTDLELARLNGEAVHENGNAQAAGTARGGPGSESADRGGSSRRSRPADDGPGNGS